MRRLTEDLFVIAMAAVILIAACAGTTYAQGSRKDDVVFNAQGRPMAGATVHVCLASATGEPCSPSALIYSDLGLTQALANPLTTDGLGNYTFYAAPGRYEIEISGPGINTVQFPNVILPSDPSTPTFTTVTTTSGISAFSLSLTGNLTVSGSTAVAGTLSVGGAPVPSTGTSNQWTGSQSFKGPNPWRDVTAYMKDSNGNAVNCSSADSSTGADTTGSMSTSSSTLAVASAVDFKNGCGIAILHAGPAPSIPTPPSTVSVSSAASSSNVVTITTSVNHNLIVGSGNGNLQGVVISSCSNSAYNGTFAIQSVANSTHFTYNTSGSGTGSATGCAANFFFGYAHGITGSTTYNYKIAAIDANMGMTAASTTALTITTGNSALSKYNYNHLMWAEETGAYMYAIYSDRGLGGSLTCVGTAFTNGYSDMGYAWPCPAFAPTNPPSSAVNETLNTTIVSGGGTTSLILAASATIGVTSANVYHDESSFITACVNDVLSDESSATGFAGSYGCYIPEGTFWINGEMPTALVNPQPSPVRIRVAGNLVFHTIPWFFNFGLYSVEGVGGGGAAGSFDHEAQTPISVSSTAPAAVVLKPSGGNVTFSGFSLGGGSGIPGDGIWIDGGAMTLDNLNVNMASSGGAAFRIETQSIDVFMNHDWVSAPGSNGLPSILFDYAEYAAIAAGFVYVNDLVTFQHGFGFIGPGGNGAGPETNSVYISNWLQENQDPLDNGMMWVDSGPNASGTSPFLLLGVNLRNVANSDIATQYNNLFVLSGNSSNALGSVNLSAVQPSGMVACVNGATLCTSGGVAISNLFSGNGPPDLTYLSQANGFVQDANYHLPIANAANVSVGPSVLLQSAAGVGAIASPAWAMMFSAPSSLAVSSTGSGSLAGNTYCIGIAGTDLTATPNETNLSNIVCQAVSTGSDINLSWNQGLGGSLNAAMGSFTLYYCTVGSGMCDPSTASNTMKITGLPAGSNPVTYNFTSTSSAAAAVPNLNSEAMLSWLSWDYDIAPSSCFFCVNAHSDMWPVGFGVVPTMNAGVNLFTKLGIRAGTQYQAAESSAPSGVASVDQLWADSTAHQWKKIENNGAAFTVAGTLSGTSGSIGGSALTAGQCASGTVSISNAATSMTVSVSPNTYPGDGFIPWGYVSASGTVTVKVCAEASGTPAGATYNVRVIE